MEQLISPLKMKEQLLDQLTTQIQDLERFVEFLQGLWFNILFASYAVECMNFVYYST